MSGPLVILTGLIYFGVAIDQFTKGNYPLAILFLTYASSAIPYYLMVK